MMALYNNYKKLKYNFYPCKKNDTYETDLS